MRLVHLSCNLFRDRNSGDLADVKIGCLQNDVASFRFTGLSWQTGTKDFYSRVWFCATLKLNQMQMVFNFALFTRLRWQTRTTNMSRRKCIRLKKGKFALSILSWDGNSEMLCSGQYQIRFAKKMYIFKVKDCYKPIYHEFACRRSCGLPLALWFAYLPDWLSPSWVKQP